MSKIYAVQGYWNSGNRENNCKVNLWVMLPAALPFLNNWIKESGGFFCWALPEKKVYIAPHGWYKTQRSSMGLRAPENTQLELWPIPCHVICLPAYALLVLEVQRFWDPMNFTFQSHFATVLQVYNSTSLPLRSWSGNVAEGVDLTCAWFLCTSLHLKWIQCQSQKVFFSLCSC